MRLPFTRVMGLFMKWMLGFASVLMLLASLGCGGEEPAPAAGGGSGFQAELAAARAETNADQRVNLLISLADRQRQANDVTGAETTLGVAVDSAKEISDPHARAARQASVAMAYGRGGSLTDAKRVAGMAQESAAQVTDAAERLNVLILVADAQARAKDRNGAVKTIRDAESLLETIPADEDEDTATRRRIERWLGIAKVQSNLGRTEDVDRLLASVQQKIDGITNPRRKCDALAMLAAAQFAMESPAAETTLQAATDVARGMEEPISKAHALCALYEHWRDAGRAEKASAALLEAEQVVEQIQGTSSLKSEIQDKIRRLKQA